MKIVFDIFEIVCLAAYCFVFTYSYVRAREVSKLKSKLELQNKVNENVAKNMTTLERSIVQLATATGHEFVRTPTQITEGKVEVKKIEMAPTTKKFMPKKK